LDQPLNNTKNFEIDPESLATEFGPLFSKEEEKVINDFLEKNPDLKSDTKFTIGSHEFDSNEPWIQTYSGKRFTPLNPNPESIVIQDIAHALSNICRFNGQCTEFYSVAQHSVLVSYICDWNDRLWGLMHDSSEAYISDFSAPLKHSGKFENYKEVEKRLMNAICKRFNLSTEDPESVKKADKLLLSTEGRDLLSIQRSDWFRGPELPFKIIPLPPKEAEILFLKRFKELI